MLNVYYEDQKLDLLVELGDVAEKIKYRQNRISRIRNISDWESGHDKIRFNNDADKYDLQLTELKQRMEEILKIIKEENK